MATVAILQMFALSLLRVLFQTDIYSSGGGLGSASNLGSSSDSNLLLIE